MEPKDRRTGDRIMEHIGSEMTKVVADDCGEKRKIKTPFAKIIIEGSIEEPYYSILWWDEIKGECNIGFSSYCLDNVYKWYEEEFETVEKLDEVESGSQKNSRCDWTATEGDALILNRPRIPDFTDDISEEKEYIDREPIIKFIAEGLSNPDKSKAFGHDAIEIMAEIQFAPVLKLGKNEIRGKE